MGTRKGEFFFGASRCEARVAVVLLFVVVFFAVREFLAFSYLGCYQRGILHDYPTCSLINLPKYEFAIPRVLCAGARFLP